MFPRRCTNRQKKTAVAYAGICYPELSERPRSFVRILTTKITCHARFRVRCSTRSAPPGHSSAVVYWRSRFGDLLTGADHPRSTLGRTPPTAARRTNARTSKLQRTSSHKLHDNLAAGLSRHRDVSPSSTGEYPSPARFLSFGCPAR